MEILRQRGVRLIAINDGVDSARGDDDFTPFRNILEKREYLGHTINFKTRKYFKDKQSHYVPEDEWTIFENTHEPIIDQQTFDLVQKIRSKVRRYPDGWGEAAPLTGLLLTIAMLNEFIEKILVHEREIGRASCRERV